MIPPKLDPALLLLAVALVMFANLQVAGAQPDDPARRLHDLFEREWQFDLKENPVKASYLGDHRYNDRWPDVSLAAIERRYEHDRHVLEQLRDFDTASLSEADRLNFALFRKNYNNRVEGYRYRWYLLPINQRGGIQTANEVADALPFDSVKDYDDWLARLRCLPTYMDQTIALLHEGVAAGIVHPRVVIERVPDQIQQQVVADAAESPFFKPFREFPEAFSDEEKTRLVTDASAAIAEDVVPSFRRLDEFFTNAYLPAATPEVGVWQLPQGEAMYAFFARRFTTTDLTPVQIHEIGLGEVERIRAEMQTIRDEVGFDGSFEEFLTYLRTDPRFYYDNPQELLEGYRALCKRIDPTLAKLFGTLPRIPYGVEPIPEEIAPDTTTAYYRPPAADGSRAGTYFVNLYRPEVRPKFEMEVLSMHEAVPGHHLQIALAMELDDLPKFRRYGLNYTAYVEGWGLYSESLGDELGFYRERYSKFGQLTYEMWRAVRLVVDTGIHDRRWSRQRAIDFFKAHAAKAEHDITNEVDRYITWPGQALAYKIGELKIKELRVRASEELGKKFDIRAFHDVALGSGAVPLDVLERIVDEWIEKQRASK